VVSGVMGLDKYIVCSQFEDKNILVIIHVA
jgi:hypothetical protein